MGEKVTPLFGVCAIPGDIPQDVRDLVEDLLEQMNRGEIAGLAVCYTRPSGETCTDWASGTASENLMVSAVSRLNFRILRAAVDGVDE